MTALLETTALLESLTALLVSLTALIEYLDLLQFSFQSFNVFSEAVALVASMVATPLIIIKLK